MRNDETGGIIAIVEEKDASKVQRQIREINTGIMVIPNQYLHGWLHKLENKNAQKEYYLTDIVAMAVKDGVKVEAAQPAHDWETIGINSKTQLAALERIYQNEYAKSLLDQGVTLADMARIDVRGQLICGRDVEIDINCIFEGHVQLDDGVKVGAHQHTEKCQGCSGIGDRTLQPDRVRRNRKELSCWPVRPYPSRNPARQRSSHRQFR